MLKNPFERILEIANDPDDFKMLYKIYGKLDLQIMTDKYNRLTNKSKHPLIQRYNNG
jgi:hypothetical protein